MNLGFKREMKGRKTGFPEKIIAGLFLNQIVPLSKISEMAREKNNPLPIEYHYIDTARLLINQVVPKIHTIREDKKDGWHVGNDIHFIVNNRQPNRYQFAPVIPCLSIQEVKITWYDSFADVEDVNPGYFYISKENKFAIVKINDWKLTHKGMAILSTNDGFDNVDDFFSYFNKSATYKLIHWTNYKY